ncbi:hypothetical protein L6164_001284 [Bauhinia variegata]|uniref:Uncharacterized protein n=1 Tax=Bauhinia variegata TaxID=167791 RepID=A0ACB9Q974_BAUVA|nr:hypothetical protein L6164_001284 [Bauhinia variegata]
MAASSSSPSLFGIREEDQNPMKQQHSSAPSSSSAPAAAPPQKKKRNQPGTPNPDAEVIALSPKTLMATNRFICEVCNKGFQREQNLQLHRRGHNLPWKLKQKTTKEPKRKVYLCPEPTCVHHDPSRALGDLTGIKKHFSRKHGEKKWKCEKCSKKYAVQSDWKAHSKTCGTREYRCDCGTLFSRRDSFITHRAFCDALAQESARQPPSLGSTIANHLYGGTNMGLGLSNVGAQITSLHDQNNHSSDLLRLGGGGSGGGGRTGQFNHILPPSLGSSSSFRPPQQTMPSAAAFFMQEPNQTYHDQHQRGTATTLVQNKPFHGLMQFSDLQNTAAAGAATNNNNSPTGGAANNTNLFNLPFLYNSNPGGGGNPTSFSEHFTNGSGSGTGTGDNEGSNFFSGSIMGNQTSSAAPSLFSTSLQNNTAVVPVMSATALLQKAAQIGASSSNNSGTVSLLRSFGSSSSSSGGGGGGSNSKPEHKSPPLLNASSNYTTMFTTATDQNNNLNDLMNSFASGGFESGSVGLSGFEASERLSTRDFLGVGQIMRSMSGNMSQREQQQQQQQGFSLSSLEKERNAAAPSAQSFGGGGGNFQ